MSGFSPLPVVPKNIPEELRRLNSWVNWRLEERNGKPTKPPINARTGKFAKVDDPRTWAPFSVAEAAYQKSRANGGKLAGIGLVIPKEAGITGLDFDKCRDPETGELEAWASEALQALDSYTEISPSGRGLRVFVVGTKKIELCRHGRIEAYDRPDSRYLTVTGHKLEGFPDSPQPRQKELDAFLRAALVERSILPEDTQKGRSEPSKASTGEEKRATPGSSANAHPSDEDLLQRIGASKQGSEFERLWSGDTSGHGGDKSGADLALCNILAFWSGHDPAIMDRLFRRSGLMREKWDSKRGSSTYGVGTIQKAIQGTERKKSMPLPSAVHSAVSRMSSAVHSAVLNKNHGKTDEYSYSQGYDDHSAVSAVQNPETYPAPILFEDEAPPLPLVDILPSWLADMVRAVTEQGLIPVDLAFGAALGALSAATGGGFHAESLDGFAAPTGLYIGLVGGSAEGKSKALGPFREVFEEAERRARKDWDRDAPARKAELFTLEGRKAGIMTDLKRKGSGMDEATARKSLEEIERRLEVLVASPAQGIVNDVTMEELAFRLSKTKHLASLSSEGGIFAIAAGLYNKGAANIDVILHAYDVESYVVNRRAAPPIVLDAPSLTLCVGIQPSKLADLASNREFLGRGLLNRFLYIYPLSKIGTKNFFDSKRIPEAIKDRYREVMAGLMAFRSKLEEPAIMRLSSDAHYRYTEWRNDIDKRAAGSLADIKEWTCKLMDTALRLAGLIHVADQAEGISGGLMAEIPLKTMEQAIQLIDLYFIPHGRRAWFNGMVGDDDQRKAVDLLAWATKRDSFQSRDVLSSLRKSFQDIGTLTRALESLTSRNLILEQSRAYSGKGRKPAPIYKVNPSFLNTLLPSQQKQQNAEALGRAPYPSAFPESAANTAEWQQQNSRMEKGTAERPLASLSPSVDEAPVYRRSEVVAARAEPLTAERNRGYSRMESEVVAVEPPSDEEPGWRYADREEVDPDLLQRDFDLEEECWRQ